MQCRIEAQEESPDVNTNVAEAIPDVFTPFTWSVIRKLDEETNYIPGYYLWSGNVCGRIYSNIGQRVSATVALLGWDTKRVLGLLGDLFGQTPDEMVVSIHPFTRLQIVKQIVPGMARVLHHMITARLTLKGYIQRTPEWCRETTTRIEQVQTCVDLLALWHSELQPYIMRAWWAHTAGSSGIVQVMTLDRKLTKLVGKKEANQLLSNLRSGGGQERGRAAHIGTQAKLRAVHGAAALPLDHPRAL